jgi:hypothetical protein
MAANRKHAHHLLDQLGPGQFAAVVQLLETMVSPEEDGDTLSHAERKAVTEADEWLKHNRPIPHEEVLAEFGLTMNDWEKMAEGPLPEEAPHRNG